MSIHPRLDVLILNAGVALTQKYMTEEGFELHTATNHLGHFLLANLLIPLLLKTVSIKRSEALLREKNRQADKCGKHSSSLISLFRIIV